ncbi:hypothetical protein [Corynebacterium belfantii]|uniref:Membrane protein YkvI n=1 Tax=Corynebacterium belfantii TaxID=2014537 RepID=A0ABS0LDQ8_9CORY|nr:hypothetical protein [Corynebacterium belfantii]OLN15208.1 hypothetical protein BUE64_08665 [Corynebacterium diphtheriae subsp. lausannense]MBG9325497.1 hypothetical protein [Corynebacterium belfantii]MBG9347563.1 hypothetical protein [Corynebacterium belfantii]MBG9354757.1 hypothetical protein [Corynebacterium belfantii]QBZ30462.1 hypothetical protein E4653_12270 [Corynebacterium diphtheriae subsp. lausannense]
MIQRALGISMAFIGVLVGASFASGREALQYFVAFGNWGIVGAIVTSICVMIAGISMLQLGSYHRAKDHNSVFTVISGPVTSRVLDIATMTCLFCIGFAMFAGAGSNMKQQFGWDIWIGAGIMLALVLLTGLLDVDKVTKVIGAVTPFIIVLISIGTMYTIFTAQPDFTHLNEQAQEIPTTLPNWWVSAINSVGLQVIVVVSMAIVIGGNFLDSREVGLGGVIGGFIFLFLLAVLVGSMYISVETVLETDMPTLAMVTKIHPALGTLMAFAIYGMIYNTAIGMFYALAKRLTRGHRQHFYKVYVAIVLVGFVLSFIGFSELIGWVYPILGYMGILCMFVIGWSWWKHRRELESETQLRRRARELMAKRFEGEEALTQDEEQEIIAIARISNIPEHTFIEEIATEINAREDITVASTLPLSTADNSVDIADLESAASVNDMNAAEKKARTRS